jgi:hypothetical protein
MSGHGLANPGDATAFLARLTRLDPAAVVRLRSRPPERTALWGRLPWAPLVSRMVPGPGPGDATVSAGALLSELGRGGDRLPTRRDADWRWPLPPEHGGRVVERIPAGEVRRVAAAAAGTLRWVGEQGVAGRAVGQRALRDALLDHVAIEVTDVPDAAETRVQVSQRLVQALVRMGFLGPAGSRTDQSIQVRLAGRWVGLVGPFGSAWLPRGDQLAVRMESRPNR